MTDLATPIPGASTAIGVTTNESIGVLNKTLSPKAMAFKRYLNHRAAVVSAIVLAILVLFVAFSGITARYGVNEAIFKAEEGVRNQNLSPRAGAWFGTDANGRDLYSRLIYGAKISLILGLFTAIISVTLGTLIGAIAGLKGGWFDDIMMRVTDVFLVFPTLVALVVIRGALKNVPWAITIMGEPSSIRFLVFLLSLLGWMGVARLVRGQIKQLKEREFIEATTALGAKTSRIVLRHLLPNSIGQIMVALTFGVVGAITAEATLSFFGFGPDAGAGITSLGLLVKDSKAAVQAGYWWAVVFPCGILVIISLCINFIGDGLRDAVDPKMQQEV